ncbi:MULTISPECIES: hypothetical protein [unclassified Oceanispirochaeta]|uniref:hypothetical protein n=1 Tax=unclassified Oceanispirochaeta TaxID=2635722 RepID=UPI001314B319|nr:MULTISPECIES: hypothetical protein [unclassified Oceanispirochaeta]MBF9018043.1 hypothetical protein [Oceanispirochaeta sp. M2]NPD73876.1 hypothetical protein [Oceanispirochaeta sp. M1]
MYELYNNYDNLYQNRKVELEQNLAARRRLIDYKNQQKSANNNHALIFLLAFRNLLSR